MNFFVFLQNFRLLHDCGKIIKKWFGNSKNFAQFFAFCSLFLVWFGYDKFKKLSNEHYNLAVRDNENYRNISDLLQACGDKSSVMVAAVSSDKKGVIRDFYSCDGNSCPSNIKEKNSQYRKNYVVDEETYNYLEEIGESDQIQTIDLVDGELISPITKTRLNLHNLPTLDALLEMSHWYQEGELKTLKVGAIVDPLKFVIYTISLTSKTECPKADVLMTSIKQTINKTQDKNNVF